MTELINPIVGPLDVPPKKMAEEHGPNFDLCAGGHIQLPTSVTEQGEGYQLCADLYSAPNARDIYGIGGQISFDHNNGGDFYPDQDHTRYLGTFSSGTRGDLLLNLRDYYTGIGKSGGTTTLELGSVNRGSLFWKTSGNFGVSTGLYAGLLSGIPFNSNGGETTSLLSFRFGLDLRLMSMERPTTPAPEGVTDQGAAVGALAMLHRLGRSYGIAKAMAGPSEQAQDYSNQVFGAGSLPSDRLKDVAFINSFNLFSAGSEDGNELSLELKTHGGQTGWLVGAKIATTAAAFAASAGDNSSTMLTQGFAGGLGLIHLAIANGQDLNLENRRLLNDNAKKEKGRELFLYSALLNGIAFGAGWAGKGSKTGRALLQGSEQAMMSTTSTPDPAETGLASDVASYHFVYQWMRGSGTYLGYRKTNHLSSENLYSSTALLAQAFGGSAPIQEAVDSTTNRDPLYKGAKAMAIASLGLEKQTGTVSWSAGVRTLLAYGEGPQPVPGIGAEQQMLLTFGGKTRFEFGVGVSEDVVDGNLKLGMDGVIGGRF